MMMTNRIVSKVPDKEGDNFCWPFGDGQPMGEKGFFFTTKDGSLTKVPPEPCHNVFGRSAYIVGDTIEAYQHPATGQVVESRSQLRAIDSATGTITTDKYQKPDPSKQQQIRKQKLADTRENLLASMELVKSGNTPFTEDQKAEFRARDKQIDQTLGVELFTKIGKKRK